MKARRAIRPPPCGAASVICLHWVPSPSDWSSHHDFRPGGGRIVHLWVRVCGFCALCADLGDHVCLGDRVYGPQWVRRGPKWPLAFEQGQKEGLRRVAVPENSSELLVKSIGHLLPHEDLWSPPRFGEMPSWPHAEPGAESRGPEARCASMVLCASSRGRSMHFATGRDGSKVGSRHTQWTICVAMKVGMQELGVAAWSEGIISFKRWCRESPCHCQGPTSTGKHESERRGGASSCRGQAAVPNLIYVCI